MSQQKEAGEEEIQVETEQPVPEGWEPNIVAFTCHYCAFAAADLAGVMRLTYPHNVKIIRLPCTGKIDQTYILRAFEKGVDGVFVAGCLEGQCHFLEGNLIAKKRVFQVHRLIRSIGIDPKRLHFYNLSAAMGPRWAEMCQEFTERIALLGPSPIRRKLMEKALDNKKQAQEA